MVAKILAGVLAVAVLSVGGYAYWQYSDGGTCCPLQAAANQLSGGDESASETPPCCQQPSRTGLRQSADGRRMLRGHRMTADADPRCSTFRRGK